MAHSFYETIHKASDALPHLDFNNENLNYLSHYHEEFELVYVSRGSLLLQLGAAVSCLEKGDIALILPGEIHSYTSSAPNKVYILKFLVPAGWDTSNLTFNRCIVTGSDPAYEPLFDEICRIHHEYAQKEDGYQLAIQKHLLEILLVFLRVVGCQPADAQAGKRKNAKISFLNQAQAYIRAHFREDITLDAIAAHCQYSKYYFSHCFKAITGKSFLDYIALYRVEQAIQLMGSQNRSMTELALMTGFSSIRSFNRAFKKYTGVSPTEYQKRDN